MDLKEYMRIKRQKNDLTRYVCDYDHWWRRNNIRDWFQFFLKRPKRIWWRAKRGFCLYDLWDYGDYFLTVMEEALRKYAAEENGCPSAYFPDAEWSEETKGEWEEAHERWIGDVNDIADRIAELLYDHDNGGWTPEEREKKNEFVFAWLAQHWYDLWW